MKERIKEIGYVLEDFLKRIIGEITPDKKLVCILLVLFIATLANLYMTFKAVQALSSNDKDSSLNIGHINRPEVIKHESTLLPDSLKTLDDEAAQP